MNDPLKTLETPDFLRALAALTEQRPLGLITVGRMDDWLTAHVDAEAAAAWRAYRDAENMIP